MRAKRLIVANWKMNGVKADGSALASAVVADRQGDSPDGPAVVLCPPATLIDRVTIVCAGSSVAVGAQDCHPDRAGAHTGDLSAEMLADLGCRYVIVGHSERRADHGENDALVKAKAAAALRAGLTAIVCVGETLVEREAGRTVEIVSRQLEGSLPAAANAANSVVAYEPVWAIGTGRTASAVQVAEVHGRLRGELARRGAGAAEIRLLYGGSVKPDNARELLAIPNVDGALVGGASLKAAEFAAIVRAAPRNGAGQTLDSQGQSV